MTTAKHYIEHGVSPDCVTLCNDTGHIPLEPGWCLALFGLKFWNGRIVTADFFSVSCSTSLLYPEQTSLPPSAARTGALSVDSGGAPFAVL